MMLCGYENTSLQRKYAKASEALRLQGPWPRWLFWLQCHCSHQTGPTQQCGNFYKLQTALALNKSPLVSCLEIWRFPDLGPGWVPSENGSIRSPSRESSESTSLGVKHTVMLQRLHRLTGTTPGPKLAWHKKARPPTSLLSVECR